MENIIRYWSTPVTQKDNTINGFGLVFFDETDGTKHSIGGNQFEALAPNAEIIHHRNDVYSCWNHNVEKVLGRESNNTLTIQRTAKGVGYTVQLNEKDPEHQSYKAKVERRDVAGSSAVFRVLSHRWNDDVLLYDAIELYSLDPVISPAMQSATAFALSDNEYARLAIETKKRIDRLKK